MALAMFQSRATLRPSVLIKLLEETSKVPTGVYLGSITQ